MMKMKENMNYRKLKSVKQNSLIGLIIKKIRYRRLICKIKFVN